MESDWSGVEWSGVEKKMGFHTNEGSRSLDTVEHRERGDVKSIETILLFVVSALILC